MLHSYSRCTIPLKCRFVLQTRPKVVLSARPHRTTSAYVCLLRAAPPDDESPTPPHPPPPPAKKPPVSVHHHKYLPVTGVGSTSRAAWVMTLSANTEKKCVSRDGYSVERNTNKMETVLLTQLRWVTLLPTGSYDDDDILTEAPRGHSQLRALCWAWGEGFLRWGFRRGKSRRGWSLGWGWMRTLAVSSEEAYLALSVAHEGERRHLGPGPCLNRQM